MILGLVVFFGVHTVTTHREPRARLIASLGDGGYKIGYSLVAATGLALIIWGFAHYRSAGMIDVGNPPTVLKQLTVGLMLPAGDPWGTASCRGRVTTPSK